MNFEFVYKLLITVYILHILRKVAGSFKYNNLEYNEDDLLNKLFGKKINWRTQSAYLSPNDLKSPECPEQIHLSLGNGTSQMVVMWATKNFINLDPIVYYGTNSSLMITENGTSASFYLSSQKSSAAKVHHRVVLNNLSPNTTYYYQILSGECRSYLSSFTIFPSGQDWSPSFLVYGDMGRIPKSPILQQLRYEIRHQKYHAILHSGDFAYDLATLNGMMGDTFMNQIQEVASVLPYMTCPGNHEMMENLLHYLHRFSMPGSNWPMKVSCMWYSMNIGNVHFISYSSEVYFFTCNDNKERADQYLWLERDLQEANHPLNRTLRPWIIAFGHRPMYCSNSDFDDCTYNTSRVRSGLEDLFFTYGVDLIIQAHEHSYERLWPLYKYKIWGKNYTNPNAPVHLIAGAAGCNEKFGVCVDPILKAKGEWSAFHTWLPGLYGYGRLKIVNNTHLNWQQVLGVNGQVIDDFWLIQEHHGYFKQWWESSNEADLSNHSIIGGKTMNFSYCWKEEN